MLYSAQNQFKKPSTIFCKRNFYTNTCTWKEVGIVPEKDFAPFPISNLQILANITPIYVF